MPFTFHSVPAVRPDRLARNIAYATALGLGGTPAGAGRLAVVGSAHSLAAYEETLRRWDGDIWAVNGAFPWLKERGIKSTFFSVHPTETIVKHLTGFGAEDEAILSVHCCPETYDAAKGGTRYALPAADFSSAGSVAHAAFEGLLAGYSEITLFGCDLSFTQGHEHIGEAGRDRPLMVVKAGGEDYLTTPAYYAQAAELVEMIKTVPGAIRERSAGLLRALVEAKGAAEVVWTSDAVKQMRDPDLVELGFAGGILDLNDIHIRTFTIGTAA